MSLTTAQIDQIRQESQTHSQAVRTVGEQSSVMWQSRINMALLAEDEQAVREALRTPALLGNSNCNCGIG